VVTLNDPEPCYHVRPSFRVISPKTVSIKATYIKLTEASYTLSVCDKNVAKRFEFLLLHACRWIYPANWPISPCFHCSSCSTLCSHLSISWAEHDISMLWTLSTWCVAVPLTACVCTCTCTCICVCIYVGD